MAQPTFAGVWPIMPTPLNADGTIDEAGTRRVVNFLVEGGMDGLWMFGTRGEGPNLLPQYHRRELEVAMEASNGRIPIVTGCGAPGTEHTIENIRVAESVGVDMVHVTEPYYFKMKEQEMAAHYRAVADAVKVPLVIYFHDTKYPNVRPGVCPPIIKELAARDNVVGIKVSTGDQRIMQSIAWETQEVTDNFGVMVTDGQMFVAGMLVGVRGDHAAGGRLCAQDVCRDVSADAAGRMGQGLGDSEEDHPALGRHYRIWPAVGQGAVCGDGAMPRAREHALAAHAGAAAPEAARPVQGRELRLGRGSVTRLGLQSASRRGDSEWSVAPLWPPRSAGGRSIPSPGSSIRGRVGEGGQDRG